MTERRRRILIVVLVWALLVAALAWDLTRPATDQWTARVLLSGIDFYQATLSPLADRAGVRCRFEPTCSHYAEAVIRRDGALSGGARTTWRILRCGPWTPAGTVDHP